MSFVQWNISQILAYFFIFMRVSSMILFFPILGDKLVPVQVKILMSFALSWICFSVLWGGGMRLDANFFVGDDFAFTYTIMKSIFQELLLGVLIGFVAHWIFEAAQVGGNIIGITMGFSMATVLDPSTETQTIALAQMKMILASLLFLALEGHHLILTTIMDSFRILPVGHFNGMGSSSQFLNFFITMTSEVLKVAVRLSAPILAIILATNIAFGLASRAVPQMNVFAVSFAANIIAGFLILVLSVPSFTGVLSEMFFGLPGQIAKFLMILKEN